MEVSHRVEFSPETHDRSPFIRSRNRSNLSRSMYRPLPLNVIAHRPPPSLAMGLPHFEALFVLQQQMYLQPRCPATRRERTIGDVSRNDIIGSVRGGRYTVQ